MSIRLPRVLLTSGGGALLLALAACSGGGTPVASPSPTEAVPLASGSGTATPTPTPPAVQRSVLSGRPGGKNGPVLVVKLDNTHNASPHAGLKYADVVYVEEVEYGITRYAAVFSSDIPKKIGPIRSARISDIELLAQYGKVAFSYSGAQSRLRPVIAAANLYDVSGDKGPAGYWREPGRYAPYNFFGNGEELLARAPHAAKAKNVGFTFSVDPPPGGRAVTRAVVRYPSTAFTFTYDATHRRWLAALDGIPARAAEGGLLGGTTVIVQYVTVTPTSYHDKFGGVTPFSKTVGSGKALVLRNGRAYAATWHRPTASVGTHFLVGGTDLPLAPGQVWVLLVNKTRPATLK